MESRLLVIMKLLHGLARSNASSVVLGSDDSSCEMLGQLILFALMACSNASRESVKQKSNLHRIAHKLLLLINFFIISYMFLHHF
jgi:hypothetical protein